MDDIDEPNLDETLLSIDASRRTGFLRLVGRAPPLMDHQELAVQKSLERLIVDGAAGVVCVPTGGGKTRIGAEVVVALIVQARLRVLWLAHKIELVDQAIEGLVRVAASQARDVRLGRFQAGDKKVDRRVDCVVASIATLNRLENLERLFVANPTFDLVVVDECHHAVARTWRDLVWTLRRRVPTARVLGLSATPFRNDQDEDVVLRGIFRNSVLHEVGATELIESQVLAKPNFVEVDTDEVMEFAGEMRDEDVEDFKPWQLQQIADRQARNKLMVDVYLAKRGSWGPTVFFTCTIKHCEQIAAMLEDAGLRRVKAVHGLLNVNERRAAIEAFKEGRLDVLVSAILLTEGTDLPRTRSVFMARPTRSPILFRQMIGRGLRGPRVSGTPECSVVLFHDTFADHAVEGLASRLTWLAGLEGFRFALMKLGEKELQASLARALAEDPLLAERRRQRRAEAEERLRALAGEAGLVAADEDRRLDGWWELRPDEGKPPIVMPYLRGYDSVRRLMDAVIKAIGNGQRMSRDAILGGLSTTFDSGPFFVRAAAFLETALQLRMVPTWIDIESVESGRTFEAARDSDFPDYEEFYRAAGRELLESEAMQFMRRCLRGISTSRWAESDASLWKTQVADRDGWTRLVKRSENFYDPKEWQTVVKRIRAEFVRARPDDA